MKITDGTAVNVVTVVGAVNATKAVYIEDGDELGAYYVGKTGNNVANTFTYTADNAIAEAQLDSVKSYYVGNKSTNAASSKYDTLKVSIAVTAKNEENFAAALAGDTASALAAIDLADHVSIDAVDASGVSVAAAVANKYGTNNVAAGAGVTISTGTAGARITGSKYNDVIDLTDSAG